MLLNREKILNRAIPANPEAALVTRTPQLPFSDGTICEGSRNDTLFRLGCSLQGQGCSDEEIYAQLVKWNYDCCFPPLSSEEVGNIVKSVCRFPKGSSNIASLAKGKNSFLHVSIGKKLLDEYFVKMIEGVPCIWVFDRYQTDWEPIRRCMNQICPNITEHQRGEVRNWIEIEAPREEMGDSKYIAFNNGVLDIESMELISNTPSLNILNVIPHDWNPNARSNILEDALNSWACGDLDVRRNIEEIIGLAMYRGRELAACPILIGEGANGKSTFLKFLRAVIGDENISSMELAAIGKRFQTAALVGKLVNIGDDISSSFVNRDQASVIKKVITGEHIQVEEKYGAPFSFRPYASMIFSCNEFPRIGDNSYGMHRRFVPVPFYADFSASSESRNINMESELCSEEAFEAAIVLGINALKDCLDRGQMLPSQTQEELKEELKFDNSPVYQFCVEKLGLGSDTLSSVHLTPVSEIYEDYTEFCESSGYASKGIAQFSKKAQKILNIKVERFTIDGKQQRCFIEPDRTT